MFFYIMTQRPPSIGTHPLENLFLTQEISFRNRTAYGLSYSQELTPEDIKRYELTPNYTLNDPQPYKFTFAGEEITEYPKVTGHNEITTFVDGEEYDKYSFLHWFRRVNNYNF